MGNLSDQWMFFILYTLLAFPALAGVGFWLHSRQQQRDQEFDGAVSDFFELSDAQVDERIAELEELLRAEADQRNCGRHERDAREAEHFDTLPDLFEGGDR